MTQTQRRRGLGEGPAFSYGFVDALYHLKSQHGARPPVTLPGGGGRAQAVLHPAGRERGRSCHRCSGMPASLPAKETVSGSFKNVASGREMVPRLSVA